jgi:methylmalonyl-CoA mutase C-terminal domain/subunit
MTLFARIIDLLKKNNASDIIIFGGGIIPDADIVELKKIGVAEIFTPGAPMEEIVTWLKSAVKN